MYLLEETLDAIEESGHTTDDVLYVGSEDGRLQLPWDQAEPVLRVCLLYTSPSPRDP